MGDKLLTIQEVCKYLKTSKSTIYKLSQKKELPSVKIGKQLRFKKSSIDMWLEQKEAGLSLFSRASQTKNILVVDDDSLVLKSLSKFLRSHGFNAEAVESGQEAIKKIEKSSFNLIIMDVRMPQMDGIQTIKRIRELQRQFNRPAIPEMLITGYLDSGAQQQAEELGISDYLYKPFVTTDFIDRVKKKIEAASSN